MTKQMTQEEHRQRHIKLHRAMDELVADYLRHNRGTLPSETSVLQLMTWAHEQTLDPTAPGQDP